LYDRSHEFQGFQDGRGEENQVVGIHQGAGAAVAEDVNQGKARQVRAVGAADHDGVTAQVGGEAEGFPRLRVRGFAMTWGRWSRMSLMPGFARAATAS
jgi:hypothetical protein